MSELAEHCEVMAERKIIIKNWTIKCDNTVVRTQIGKR